MSDVRTDPRVHARFLSYRERHVYFGRGELREPLDAEAFGEADAELQTIVAIPKGSRSTVQEERLADLKNKLHLD